MGEPSSGLNLKDTIMLLLQGALKQANTTNRRLLAARKAGGRAQRSHSTPASSHTDSMQHAGIQQEVPPLAGESNAGPFADQNQALGLSGRWPQGYLKQLAGQSAELAPRVDHTVGTTSELDLMQAMSSSRRYTKSYQFNIARLSMANLSAVCPWRTTVSLFSL
jgi:hypothetical protein